MSLIKHLRPEIKNIATNYMPEVVSDAPYDFKKIIESCSKRDLGWATDPC